ncbi:MAG: hypothetical protein CMH56_13565 [Myxococcales bacterium]|nr:hypothetical protein [Myxococcales bacterium]|tara:strand:+ start:955 stop:1920 length:966 start_codon:yes stop_codon:yes gene_type:complete
MGHTVTVDSASFWRGPAEEDLLLWMWPEGFFRHSLGGRLGHLTLKQRESFESMLSQWKAKVPVMGVLHNFMPRCVLGNAGRHWIALYRHLVQHSDGVIHLGQFSLDNWTERFGLEEQQPAAFRVSHGLFEQLLTFQHAEQILPLKRDGVPRIFIPGDLRTKAEVNMVLDAIAYHQGHVQWVLAGGETFNGRRKPTYWRLNKLSKSHEVFCYQRRLSDHELVGEVLAADCVVVPRTRGLNSGIPFLAATFGKPVAMPRCGNQAEHAGEVGGTLFEPDKGGPGLSQGVVEALAHGPVHKHGVPSWQVMGTAIDGFLTKICQTY